MTLPVEGFESLRLNEPIAEFTLNSGRVVNVYKSELLGVEWRPGFLMIKLAELSLTPPWERTGLGVTVEFAGLVELHGGRDETAPLDLAQFDDFIIETSGSLFRIEELSVGPFLFKIAFGKIIIDAFRME